jgi:hypothetical protein
MSVWKGYLLSNTNLIVLVICQFRFQLLNSILRSLLTRGQFNPQLTQSLHNIHTQHKPFSPLGLCRRSSLGSLLFRGARSKNQIVVITVLFGGEFGEAGGFDGSDGGDFEWGCGFLGGKVGEGACCSAEETE